MPKNSNVLKFVTRFWKTYHLYTRDKQNNYKYVTKLEMRLWLNSLIAISVRDTLNYQNNCRNTFGWLVGVSYKAAKLDILIISLVCRW